MAGNTGLCVKITGPLLGFRFARSCIKLTVLLILSPIFCACQQHTIIRTKPERADIWVNQVPVGKSPASYEVLSGFPSTARLKVSLDGYETIRDIPMEKSYRSDISLLLLIPGIVPYFFSARFDPEIIIPLKPEKK
jgi:hypothetical protein